MILQPRQLRHCPRNLRAGLRKQVHDAGLRGHQVLAETPQALRLIMKNKKAWDVDAVRTVLPSDASYFNYLWSVFAIQMSLLT